MSAQQKTSHHCSVDSCYRAKLARGYCGRHYNQFYRGKHVGEEVSLIDRFWSMVNIVEDGCWEWKGTTAGGYGQFTVIKQKAQAHRVSYEFFVGRIPHDSFVCHHCDNKLCVRPDHLFLGTSSDNLQDMIRKHGHPKQRASYRAKLTPDNVRAIRASDETTTALAKQFGVTYGAIQKVRNGQNWKHIT